MKIVIGPTAAQVNWHVLDAPRYEDWLERRPWLCAEPPFVAWTPRNVSVGATVLDGAQRMCSLQEGGVWWTVLGELRSSGSDLGAALAEWAQISPRSDRELADAVGASLAHRPRVFVARLRSPDMVAACRAGLERLTELTQKLRGMPLCFVLAVASSDDIDLEVNRLDVAWPETLRRLPTEDDRWVAYLHERVAWHVCGRLDAAVEVLGDANKIGTGNDAELERILNSHSRGHFAELPAPLKQSLLVSLKCLHDHPQLCVPVVLPGAGEARRPAPWLARAILLARPDHPQRRFLRAAVTCRPMAMRLLGRCIDLEARVKDLAVDHLAMTKAIPEGCKKETIEAFERIHGRMQGVEASLVPPGHPLPDHPWEMASLGTIEVLARYLVPPDTSQVRWVRNALAHGAPVGWAAFGVVERLEETISGACSKRHERAT